MRTRGPRSAPVAAGSATLLALLVATALLAAPASATAEGPPRTTVGGELLASEGVVVDAPGADGLPTVRAASWVLADLETGEVLAARNPHGLARPASTLKILTALTLLPTLEPDATYTARWEDANAEGSRVGVVPDATYAVHNLFEALFLVSGNDAASALAHAAGGVQPTVDAMNRTARDLGALDTTAVNPSGLDAPGQLTSAYDLAVLTRAAMARDDFRTYAGTVKSQFPGKMPRAGKARKTFEIYTQDRLLLNYRGALGVKTGWTTKARGTFVGVASRGGRTLVATVLRTDHEAWRQAAALLTWGFRNAERTTAVGTLDTSPPSAAGRVAGPGAADAGTADGAGASSDESLVGLPGWPGLPDLHWTLQVPLALLLVVALLRARVLLRRRLRRVRLEPLPRLAPSAQSADRRRATLPASQAPRAAPTSMPRTRPPGRADEVVPTRVGGAAS